MFALCVAAGTKTIISDRGVILLTRMVGENGIL